MATLVRDVHSEQEFRALLSAADPKRLVVVDFSATWCGPCHAIAPFFTQLSTKYRHVTFVKIDGDECSETAAAQGVTAFPTFQFFKATRKLAEIKGANPTALEQLVRQHQGPADGGSSSGGASGESAAVPAGQSDLTEYIDTSQVECLNQSVSHTVAGVWLADPARYLESDSDEQLIIAVPFRQNVKLHSVRIAGPKDKAPKTLKTFVNRGTLGFDEADGGVPETELLNLTEADYTPTGQGSEVAATVGLRYVRYQSVQKVVLFVQDNLGGDDVTVVSRIQFFGTPVETTKMQDLRKMGHEHGEAPGGAASAAGAGKKP